MAFYGRLSSIACLSMMDLLCQKFDMHEKEDEKVFDLLFIIYMYKYITWSC